MFAYFKLTRMLMTARFRVGVFFIVVALLLLPLIGCGERRAGTAIVRGTVTLNGKAVPNGTVNFIPEMGPSATGEIQPDGSYTLTTYKPGDGAVLGTHKVVIVAMADNAGMLPEARSPTPPPIVPVKYTSPATTDLTAQVEDKENTINFDLK
jgi:hypothetical protein